MIKLIKNDFNLFKNFYFVANNGSFSKAAKELCISQPTVSYNVKCLEENLECKLFLRKPKGVELTQSGIDVLKHIESAYNSILLAEQCIKKNKTLSAGTLNIGGPSFIINKYITPIIIEFSKKYPAIKFNIITKSTKELLDMLYTNKIDILIDTLPISNLIENVKANKIWQKSTCFATAKDTAYKWDPKSDRVLILPDKNSDIGKYILQELILTNWLPSNVKMEITSTEIMLNMCLNGMGIGYFMEDYIEKEIETNQLTKIDLGIQMPTIDIAYFYIPDYSTYVLKEFINELGHKNN